MIIPPQEVGGTGPGRTDVNEQVDDLNRRFTFSSGSFDLVQSRLVASGINRSRWPTYIRDIVR